VSDGGEGTRRLTPEKIGKYSVVDRVGRGGMGMIFKAHDPILDRQVALKVISPEVEVTDELRTRFFREAKACAKLNHPNIVTVYDMGEDEGRLFIVMELLEGEELRQFIKASPTQTLEEKLSVMLQVCSGLHYAHQKGIVHRDMKPGNIFLQRNGHVKILDFGIAHIATTEAGLTRTGLIMGTLRYISPEQVRGRADHRSDMFSVGSVFYELLTSRPPFLGDDAMQLLEQLRTEDPPSPTEVDPTIPPELTAVVQRAMRKNPDERFHDLEEMRAELEAVRGRLLEERQHVLARVRRQRDRIVRLQAALAERVGAAEDDTPIRAVSERHGLVAAQAAEREFAGRIEAMEAKIAQADALAPAFQRAHELLDVGGFEDAAEQFESIVAEMPDHQRARENLDRARAEADAQRQRELATDLLQKARTALDGQRYALCLEILEQAADLSPAERLTEEIAALRQTVLERQEALRQGRQEADEAHAQMAKARGDAQAEDVAQHAPGPWNEAEASAATAQADLRREAYAEAKQGFDQAAASYRRSLDAARQEQSEERRTAGRAREMATQGQRQAQAVGAAEYAREPWDAAEARFAEAQTAFAKNPSTRAGAAFTEAATLYRRAEEAAREAREREHRRADAARERASEGRRSAETMDAEHRAPTVWQEAVGKSAEGEAALLRHQYRKAAEAFEAALALYHQAPIHDRQLARLQREDARKKQGEMTERRRAAVAVEAAAHAPSDWNEAEASAAAADGASTREVWEDAVRAFDQAAILYRRAEERSREALRARAEAEKAVEAVEVARRAAAGAQATRYASEPWKEAERAEARAVAALSQQQFAAALPLFDAAGRLYAAAQAAGIAAEAEVRSKAGQPPAEAPVAQVDKTPRQAEDAGRRPGFDDAPTVLIRPTETVKPSTAIADRKDASALPSAPMPGGAIRLPPAESGAGQLVPPRVSRAVPHNAKKPAAPFWRLRTRVVVAGIGGLAALTLVVFWWRSEPPPVSPPAVTQPLPAPRTATPPVAPSSEPPGGRDEAQKLQSQTPVARDEATKAGAEPSTPTPAKGRSVQNPDRVVATTPPPSRPNPGATDSGRPPAVQPRPPAQPSAPQQPGPSRIRESIEQKLRGAKLLRTANSDAPGVAVEEVGADGSVRLVGVLQDAAARQTAADLVRTVPGVTAVDVRRVTVQKGWVTQ
jgi:predicted Ser/Thr protein kinase